MSADSHGERPRRPVGESGEPLRPDRPRPANVSPRLEAVVDAVGAISGRLIRVWRALSPERRLAGFASLGLFATLFLPWYQETVTAQGVKSLRSLSDSLTGWGAFSLVEAAVLLVAAAVLALLFVRAEGRAFHVPGGDGTVITVAGGWTCVLIIWRVFDKQGTTGHGLYTVSSGIEWGIFVALAVAGLLTLAGTRIRRAHDPEPPLPGERPRRRRTRDARERTPERSGPYEPLEGSEPREPEAGSEPRERRPAALELDIEETWLQLEDDRSRRGSPPPPRAAEPPAPVEPPTDATALLEPATDPTSPLPPPAAAPAPRRRRPRSIAEPPAEDPVTLPSRPRE
jgi:hypothetical protein